MEATVDDMSGMTASSSSSVPAISTVSSDMGSASEELSWSQSFILEQLGLDDHHDDNVPASEVSSYELGFEIPQEVKTEEKTGMAVPARAVDVSANQTRDPQEENVNRGTGSGTTQTEVQPKTRIRVVLSPKKDSQIDIERLSLSELRDLCMKQRNQIKSSERIITNMNKLVIEEQEMRTSFRKKRDETIRDHNRMKEELSKLTLMHEQLLREIEELRRNSASDKLIIQQLEAKLADFKYDNKKMSDQLKETGEMNVGKLKDEVRELKRLTKKYEKTIDEKNETISKLRNNLNELKAQMSKETGVRNDKKEIDDLKRMVSSQMMRMWSEMKKEIHGPSSRIAKNSPEYFSETDIEQIPRSSYASSTYSNDDYASYDSYTPSPASSLTSSISPPLSISSARSVVTSEKSTPPSLPPSSVSPPLSDSCSSSVVKRTSPAPSLKTPVSPPLETQSASVANSSETTMSNSYSTDKIPFSPPTSPSVLNCSKELRTNSTADAVISSPIVSEKDVCDDYSGNILCKPSETLKLVSSGASGTNQQTVKKSIFETMFTLPSLQALESIDPVKSTPAVPTPVFLVEIKEVESCDNLSSESNTVKDKTPEPVESVPVGGTPSKVSPRTLETKQRSPKRRKVRAKNVARSIFALSDSDSGDSSPDESDSKPAERKTTPKKLPSTFSVNFSPPRTRSQSRTPTPSPKKATEGIFSPPKSVTKHAPSTSNGASSSSSDSEFFDSSDSEESSEDSIVSPSKVVINVEQSLDQNRMPRPQVLQDEPYSEAHTEDTGSTHKVSNIASMAPPRNALLSDDLRMSSDDDDLSSEEIKKPARDSTPQVVSVRTSSMKKLLNIHNANIAGNESISLTTSEAREVPPSQPTSTKAISPKRKLSFPSAAKGKMPPVAKKEESVLPARVQTLPSVFRPQKPLESVAVKRLRSADESKSIEANPEPLYNTQCKRSRISRCTEAPTLKPAEAIKPNPPARSLPKLKPAIAPAVPKANIRTPEPKFWAPVAQKAISNGNSERKLSARERIGMSVQIVAVGSGENICDKRRLELRVKEQVEKRKAEKVNGESKQTHCGETGPRPVTKSVPPVRTALLRQSSAPIWKPPVGKAPPKAAVSNLPAIRVPCTAESIPESMEIEPPKSLPTPAKRIAAVTPVMTRSLTRKTSLPEIPKRKLSSNRTPVSQNPKPTSCDEVKLKAAPTVHPPVAAPSPASAVLFSPVKSPGQSAPSPARVPIPILSPVVSTVEKHAPRSKQVAVASQSPNLLESKLKKPVVVPDKITMAKLLFGHFSRSLQTEDVQNQLKGLIESGQQPITPEAFAKATYFDFADSASSYMNSRANEHMIINGAERACANMKALKELVPDLYAQLESQVVLHFCTEMISAPGRYSYQINDMLNQLAVSYGTVCRYFKLRELSFRLLLSVLISRPAQKFTFAHGFILAYPDLWSLPFEYGSLVERCILVGLMHGSLYTNSIYFKNVRCMVVDGIGVNLPTCSYAASFGALVDEFKELDFESTIQDSARAIGMLLLQANWMTSRKLIEEQTEKLLREWQEKKITDMILAVFLNTTIWVSELSRDCEPGFVDLLEIFSRINKQIDSLPSDEVSAQLSHAVKDGLLKISRLIERGPRTDPELVYYRIEDEQAVRKQIEKATHADKKKRKKYKKREAARKQKKLMDELARIDT